MPWQRSSQATWPGDLAGHASSSAILAPSSAATFPFFLTGGPAQCTGRGEKIQALRAPGRMHFVVIKPAEGLSTAKVFQQATVPSNPTSSESIIAAIGTMDLASIGRLMFNRLQEAATHLTPCVDQIASVMSRLSVLGHQLSGSGTSYFALCHNHRQARHVAAKLRTTSLGQVFAVQSLGLSQIP